jgi:release factor glutamine methyltransferase
VFTVHQHIATARGRLGRAGLTAADARLDAEVLARHALGWDRARLVAEGREPMPDDVAARFEALVSRREGREPVALITGHREFWGLDFEVSRDVLIPRPETELIVEAVCDRWPHRAGVRTIVDVGTGSGCLAVSLAVEFPQSRVLAIDISAAALHVAATNAATHRTTSRMAFVRGDLLEPVRGPVDVIVSNPPYVPEGDVLSPEIVHFEPHLALYGGPDGLRAVSRILATARTCLAAGGMLAMEFGLGQDEAVRTLARDAGWGDVVLIDDLQRIPRVAILTL